MFIAEIWNYKTIKHQKIEFEGFASIVGQNLIGKSAVLGAIESCLKNSMDKEAVRNGESYTDVRLVHDKSDLDVFWHYEEGGTYYIINGQTYEKLNGAVPPPLLEKGFGPFTSGDEKVYLWHTPQFQNLFLVDNGRSALTVDLLSHIFNVDAVYKANSLCSKDLKDSRSEQRIRRTDLNSERDRLSQLSGFPRIKDGLKDLALMEESISILSARHGEGEALSEQTASLTQDVKSLTGVSLLSPEPSSSMLVTKVQKLSAMKGYLRSLRDLKTSVLALHGIKDMGGSVDDADLGSRVQKLSTGTTLLKSLVSLMHGMRGYSTALGKTIAIEPPAGLMERMSKVSASTKLATELRSTTQLCSRLSSYSTKVTPVPQPGTELRDRLAEARSLTASIQAQRLEMMGLVHLGESLDAESLALASNLQEYSQCPACGKPLHAGEHHND